MAREKFPSDDVDRLMLRFPPGMREKLKAEADANSRSMNAEIVKRLELSFSLESADPKSISENNLREIIWKAMYRNFHQYRSGVIEDLDRMISGKQLLSEPAEDPEGAN